jgi:putative endopeptidase
VIQAVSSKPDFVRLMGRTAANFGSSVFAMGVASDAKKPVSTLYLGQGGLGMPDRDYYLTDGFKEKKQAYESYIARTFTLIKDGEPDAKANQAFDVKATDRYYLKPEDRVRVW